jgi:two-component system, cell cycle sensor histidine kinase and response regulator CckA
MNSANATDRSDPGKSHSDSAIEPGGTTGPANGAAPGGTILVIDDDDTVTEITKRILTRKGYRVLKASNGLDGIAFLKREKKVDLVILDLIMPRLSGSETLSEIRHFRKDIPVLISSGFCESQAITLFDGHTPDGYVKKPFRAAALVEAVRNAMSPREQDA